MWPLDADDLCKIPGRCATSTTSTRPLDGGRELLGGKGIGLAEMTQLGVPVPRGLHDHDRRLPRLHGARAAAARRARRRDRSSTSRALEEKAGKRFGDPDDPLLVSVRSGAAVSMPGMMDTILNLGLNDEAVDGLAQTTGNARFAYDSYRRLIQMYGEVVDGDRRRTGSSRRSTSLKRDARRRAGRRARPPTTCAELIETFKAIYADETGSPFPQDAREQLRRAVRAVFDSWDTPRAQVYRRAHEIPDDLGTAVNVVQMVFGNKGDGSGTGVCFTRDPSTGRAGRLRRVPRRTRRARTSSRASARRSRSSAMQERAARGVRAAARRRSRRLEEHYRDMQDIEFTVEDGTALPAADAHARSAPRRLR